MLMPKPISLYETAHGILVAAETTKEMRNPVNSRLEESGLIVLDKPLGVPLFRMTRALSSIFGVEAISENDERLITLAGTVDESIAGLCQDTVGELPDERYFIHCADDSPTILVPETSEVMTLLGLKTEGIAMDLGGFVFSVRQEASVSKALYSYFTG
jgi:hypothetical protein